VRKSLEDVKIRHIGYLHFCPLPRYRKYINLTVYLLHCPLNTFTINICYQTSQAFPIEVKQKSFLPYWKTYILPPAMSYVSTFLFSVK
jgi:hypothetical protein